MIARNSRVNSSSVCRQNNLGVIPYYSLASGFLTGKYRSEKSISAIAAVDLG